MNIFDELNKRGFIQQTTGDEDIRAALAAEHVSCYVGFDPTAASLHIGHLVPIMALAHMQRAGHRPIAVVGGGTGMVGDPSGKTEMRKLLDEGIIQDNLTAIKQQLSHYISFAGGAALMVNNADWIMPLNYIEFLRTIGVHFSVNRMLAAESYKQRLERGLNFIEFNYQILQAYDFLVLFQKYGCTFQMGGDDQWGNIIAGIELIRRVEAGKAHAMTFPLLTTATGQKMGKSEAGAVWLDSNLLSPYEFFQFWRNTDDRDVKRFLLLFTFLPLEEIDELSAFDGAAINQAKERLAFEVTALAHGREAAGQALEDARKLFHANLKAALKAAADTIPTVTIEELRLTGGIRLIDLFVMAGLAASIGEARKLIRGGGGYLHDDKVVDELRIVTKSDLRDDCIILRAGKKRYAKVILG
ncbi:tyrosine--tRNA ligase [bacterium]|nr:tyrosine--tRNA ligase [candidate division CSSED10-310 bacterium]